VQPQVREVAESFRRALASDRLPERDRFAILGMTAANNGDCSLLPTLRRGTQRYPDDPGIWSGLAEFYIEYAVMFEDTARAAPLLAASANRLDAMRSTRAHA
jgi:hypothetical protein